MCQTEWQAALRWFLVDVIYLGSWHCTHQERWQECIQIKLTDKEFAFSTIVWELSLSLLVMRPVSVVICPHTLPTLLALSLCDKLILLLTPTCPPVEAHFSSVTPRHLKHKISEDQGWNGLKNNKTGGLILWPPLWIASYPSVCVSKCVCVFMCSCVYAFVIAYVYDFEILSSMLFSGQKTLRHSCL